MNFTAQKTVFLFGLYAASAAAGWAFDRIGLPLPWRLGPLVLSALAYVSGLAQAKVPVRTRPFGRLTVAAQVGLTFTPAAFASLLNLAPLIVGLALISGVLASLVAVALARATNMRLAQAFVSTFPTSPVEAVAIAERLGIATAPVVLAQTVRIAMIVFLVPMSIFLVDGMPDRAASGAGSGFALGHLVLAAFAVAGAAAVSSAAAVKPVLSGATGRFSGGCGIWPAIATLSTGDHGCGANCTWYMAGQHLPA